MAPTVYSRVTPPADNPPPASPPPGADACARAVGACLDEFVDALALPPQLEDPIRYAVLGGGKRVRPLLAWSACAALGADPARSVHAGAGIELVHAFSLVHDDLPAIDNDDLRRGRPALHVAFGEAAAIMAGDAMLTLAFHLLVQRVADAGLAAALTRELTSATAAMIVGQTLDLQGADARTSGATQRLATIHEHKTGALITAACRMGAMCALHARGLPLDSPDELARLSDYARAVGLMFQIVDDLLDVEQSSDWIGKTAGTDAAAGKLTYPGVHGVEASRREIERLRRVATDTVAPLGPDAEPLLALLAYLASRTR